MAPQRFLGLLAACLVQALRLAGSMPVIKLVDVPSVVCKQQGGPGQMKAEIWPPDQQGAAAYMKVGDGACGHASQASAPPATWDRPGPANIGDCQDRCDNNVSCGAYDFCTGPGCPGRCRLFPRRQNSSMYNQTIELPEAKSRSDFIAMECFVKQVANHTKPHVVSFLRTSSKEVAVSFTLTDSHPEKPRTLVPKTNVSLQAFKSRRLDASAVIGAKRRLSAPIRRGKGSGGHGGGHGSHGGHGGGKASSGHTARGSGRPGGHTRSGERAAGRFSNPGNARLGTYGYSQRAIASRYPTGYTSTPYGYSGLSSHNHVGRMYVASNAMSFIAGMHLFHSMGAMGYGYGHYGHYISNGTFGYFNLSNSTGPNSSGLSGGALPVGKSKDPSEGELLSEPFHDGVIEIPVTEDLRQDDMMATGFVPDTYTYPLVLTVEGVHGEDYDHDRICPPAGWHPNVSLSADPSWSPPGHQDLFFSITQLEDFSPPPDEAGDAMILVLKLFGGVLGIVFLCSICGRCFTEAKESSREFKDFERNMQVQMSFPATTLHKMDKYSRVDKLSSPSSSKLGRSHEPLD